MAAPVKISAAELSELLKKHDGDRGAVAEETGYTRTYISHRINKVPQLRALWSKSQPLDPSGRDVETRKPPNKPSSDLLNEKRDLEVWQKNGRDVFMTEISTLLHDKDNIKKLDIFKGFEGNVGLFMARCLEMTQNVNVRQNITLFEVTEELKKQIMSGGLDEESEILKTRLFVSCCEQQGKFYDRLLRGLEAMLKLTEKEQGKGRKKVGFQPLKDLEELENAEK